MAQITPDMNNPCGLDGVEFVEFSGPDAGYFDRLFIAYGFKKVASLKERKIDLYRQGDINFIVNCDPGSFATKFAGKHGPCISATGFRTKDAVMAFRTATTRGARGYMGTDTAATPFPAIYGIGDSLVYFVDEGLTRKLYEDIFKVKAEDKAPRGVGFKVVDHFTNNVPRGEMQKWCDFYTQIFNFRETRYFDIRGKQTGLISKVMRSPCNKFAVPINEPSDQKSQIQEYLDEYRGSGIQHLALLTENISETLDALRSQKQEFLAPPPDTYYRMLKDRLPGVTEDVERLRGQGILVDGDDKGYLLQIFSKNIIGPIFFEVIQRKGHHGFGEGNFQALFDSIEADQKERGYL